MSLYRTYTREDDEASGDGDGAFLGVNCKMSPELLTAGMVANAVNKRFRRGVGETRPGVMTAAWAALPGNADGSAAQILGSGVYSDPNGISLDAATIAPVNGNAGLESLLLATANAVYLCRQGFGATAIPVNGVATQADPAGNTIAGPCDLVQTFAGVLLFRGANQSVLQWDGILGDGFNEIPANPAGDGTVPIPPSSTGIMFASRMLVVDLTKPVQQGQIAVSDILDYTHYSDSFDEFAITTASNEKLTALLPFTDTGVLCFKERSTWLLTGIYGGDLSTTVQRTVITPALGAIARRSIAAVGADVFFLAADRQLYRLTQVVADRIVAAPVPVSDPVRPWFERINPIYAPNAAGALFGDYYYLAVALDQSTVNNAVFVYNTVTSQWESMDVFAGAVSINEFVQMNYYGVKRLMGIDQANGRVLIMGEGWSDCIGGVEYQISDLLESRGYILGYPAEGKSGLRARAALATANPNYTLTAVTEGTSNALVAGVTKDRTQYAVYAAPAWDATNSNSDFAAPYREDYALFCGPGVKLGGMVTCNALAETIERQPLGRVRGRWMALQVANTQGRCNVRAVEIEGLKRNNGMRESQ